MTIAAIENAQGYDWQTWLLGIFRSFVSGGSAAMVSGLTSIGIAPDKFNLNADINNTLKLMGVMFLFQGGYRMFEFLQLHGAPDKLQVALNTADEAAQQAVGAIKDAKDAAEIKKPGGE